MGVTDLTRWPITFDHADVGANPLPLTIFGQTNAGPYNQKLTMGVALGTFNWTAHDAAEGDQVILTDFNGKEVWRSLPATGADFGDAYRVPDSVYIQGLILTQIQHGVLEIHFR